MEHPRQGSLPSSAPSDTLHATGELRFGGVARPPSALISFTASAWEGMIPIEADDWTVSSDEPLALFCPLASPTTFPSVLILSAAGTTGLGLMVGWGASGCSGLGDRLEPPHRRFCRREGLPRRFFTGGSTGEVGGGWDVPFTGRGWMGT